MGTSGKKMGFIVLIFLCKPADVKTTGNLIESRHRFSLLRSLTPPPPGAGFSASSCARRACRDSGRVVGMVLRGSAKITAMTLRHFWRDDSNDTHDWPQRTILSHRTLGRVLAPAGASRPGRGGPARPRAVLQPSRAAGESRIRSQLARDARQSDRAERRVSRLSPLRWRVLPSLPDRVPAREVRLAATDRTGRWR